jgi:hypothetical protein
MSILRQRDENCLCYRRCRGQHLSERTKQRRTEWRCLSENRFRDARWSQDQWRVPDFVKIPRICRVSCDAAGLVIFDVTNCGLLRNWDVRIFKENSIRSLRRRMQTKSFSWALVLLQFYGMIENGMIIHEQGVTLFMNPKRGRSFRGERNTISRLWKTSTRIGGKAVQQNPANASSALQTLCDSTKPGLVKASNERRSPGKCRVRSSVLELARMTTVLALIMKVKEIVAHQKTVTSCPRDPTYKYTVPDTQAHATRGTAASLHWLIHEGGSRAI